MTFPCIKCKIHQYTNTQIHLHITFTHYIYKLHLHITFTLYIYTLHSVENLIFLSNNECHILTLCRMEKLTVVSKAKSSSLKLSNLHVADCNVRQKVEPDYQNWRNNFVSPCLRPPSGSLPPTLTIPIKIVVFTVVRGSR